MDTQSDQMASLRKEITDLETLNHQLKEDICAMTMENAYRNVNNKLLLKKGDSQGKLKIPRMVESYKEQNADLKIRIQKLRQFQVKSQAA